MFQSARCMVTFLSKTFTGVLIFLDKHLSSPWLIEWGYRICNGKRHIELVNYAYIRGLRFNVAIKDLIAKIRQRSLDGAHSVSLSYLEVYNETVRDLLSPGRPLVLREDKQGIVAVGLTQYRAFSTVEVMRLLQQGNQNCTIEPTRVNETSCSHAILQVVAEYKVEDLATNAILTWVGKLSLNDLAGSERALATDQQSLQSLLALSSCINALVEGKKDIPYRNSKLTQLLKDSVGGACNTVMIANVSPSNLVFGDMQNRLHWADRAKEIKTAIKYK